MPFHYCCMLELALVTTVPLCRRVCFIDPFMRGVQGLSPLECLDFVHLFILFLLMKEWLLILAESIYTSVCFIWCPVNNSVSTIFVFIGV